MECLDDSMLPADFAGSVFPLSVKQRGGTAYNKDIVIKDKKIKKCCKSHRKTGMNMIY